MRDIHVREISLNDEQHRQRQVSKDKIRFNWEFLAAAWFSGLITAIVLFLVAACFLGATVGILMTLTVGSASGVALGYCGERRRLARIPEGERRWHADFIALCDEVEKFSERLEAFRHLASTFGDEEEVEGTLMGKYARERKALAERLRVCSHAMALKRFEAIVAKNTDGRFRDTRDVAEQVFIHRVRVAKEEAEIRTLLSDESPNEAQFRELETEYGDDVPVSKAVRRAS